MRFLILLMVFIGGCTPKALPPLVEKEKTNPEIVQVEQVSLCPKFSDAPNADELETYYVLYRDFLKVGNWDEAYLYWKKVYEIAPAADGKRNTVYADGIRFYERFLSLESDSKRREEIIDTIFNIYDEIERCYQEGGYIPARKAFDLYYKYPERSSTIEVFNLFKEALDIDGIESPDFIVNPFSALLVDLYMEEMIDQPTAKKYTEMLLAMIDYGFKNCKGVACERWEIIKDYAPSRLEAFESVSGFYDCAYYMDKYYAEFLSNPADCDVIRTVYSRLKWGGCDLESERFKNLIKSGNEKCVPEPGSLEVAYNCLKEADYNCALVNFEKAVAETEDIQKKARYLLLMAKIYQVHLKNFPQSRRYALQAADIWSTWGEPYLHIGRLYASSGPLCGPGRGWDSQVVVWTAIDMWNKAKRVDSGSVAEANQWIGRYAQYMPDITEIFQRGLKEGDSFRVGCWIQENTTIRAAIK
jgi:tetratricopeptide (TPR) repeat protein